MIMYTYQSSRYSWSLHLHLDLPIFRRPRGWYWKGSSVSGNYPFVSGDLSNSCMRFQVLTAASMMFRVVLWVILPCKMIVDRRFRGAYCLHHQGSAILFIQFYVFITLSNFNLLRMSGFLWRSRHVRPNSDLKNLICVACIFWVSLSCL
jgi:hypothetical protein